MAKRMSWKRRTVLALFCGMLEAVALAQEAQPAEAVPQTKIQVNFLNSCRPAQAEQDKMGMALALVKAKPVFSADFEVSRGLTTLSESEARAAGIAAGSGATPSIWVRIRREFPEKAVLTNAQYSLSVDGGSTSELLALHLHESKTGETQDVLEILISDSVHGRPAEVVKVETPPDRIRIERFGKASIVLARCGGIDQSAYEPLFQAAAGILQKYRTAMAVKTVVPAELAHLLGPKESKASVANH